MKKPKRILYKDDLIKFKWSGGSYNPIFKVLKFYPQSNTADVIVEKVDNKIYIGNLGVTHTNEPMGCYNIFKRAKGPKHQHPLTTMFAIR